MHAPGQDAIFMMCFQDGLEDCQAAIDAQYSAQFTGREMKAPITHLQVKDVINGFKELAIVTKERPSKRHHRDYHDDEAEETDAEDTSDECNPSV